MNTKADLTIGVMYPSKYLACEDLKGKTVTVLISSTKVETVVMTGGAKEFKPVITLAKPKTGEVIQKQLIAGKTNAFSIALLLGTRVADWDGKRISLCPDVDLFGKEQVPCIRVEGSPDAAPDRAAAYAKAWKGERKRGALVSRIKKAIKRMEQVNAPPVEHEERDHEEEAQTPATPPPTGLEDLDG